MSNIRVLKLRAANKIARQEAATVVAGVKVQAGKEEEAPRFYLLELELKDELKVEISGAKPFMPLQASLVKAIDTVIRGRGSDWNIKQFWEWAKDFENGFSDFSIGAKGEFADRIKKKRPWGKEYDSRPKILEVKQPKSCFYKVIQLVPDRKSDKFELFTGSYKEIASLINNWWNQKAGKAESGGDRNSDVRMLSGHPKIYLYFQEKRPDSGERPKEGRISFRLMGETGESISLANLRKITLKIKEIFGKREGYFWEKGRRYAAYNHWELGYKLQLLSPSVTEGKKLIEDILKIQGHSLNPARMTYSQNQAEEKAFPKNAGKKRILGEEVALPQKRPNCKVAFRYASVEIGELNAKLILFSVDSNTPADPRFK